MAPRYISPYEIVERVDKVAYSLVLPMSMDHIHNVFYVSSLCKYIGNLLHVLMTKEIQLCDNLSYEERSIQVLDKRIKQFKNQQIPLVKLFWRNHKV